MDRRHLSDETRRAQTERVRRFYDRMAGSRSMARDDGYLLRGATEWIRSRAHGETLEIGVGRGRTLPAYPADVRLTGVELSGALLAVARRRAVELGIDATFIQGDAQELPFHAQTFDVVVFSLVLCTVPDARRAVTEAIRVLRPGGRLVWVEHVRSPHVVLAALQRLMSLFTVRQSGDHYDREPLALLAGLPLEIEAVERQRLGIVEFVAARKLP